MSLPVFYSKSLYDNPSAFTSNIHNFTNYTKITVLSVLKWKSKVSMAAVPPVKPLPCFLQ